MNARDAATAGMPARWSLTDGTVEALKWFAFAAMVADHIDVIWFARGEPWLSAIGRLAMPIFAVVFGYNLSRSRDPGKVIQRLLVVGLLVQPIAMLTINQGRPLPLNILLTFAAGGAVVYFTDRRDWLLAGALGLLGAIATDYGAVGVSLVAASWLYFRSRDPAWLVPLVGAAASLCLYVNGNAWALLGFAAVVGAGWVHLPVPRARWAFLLAYPGHMVALWIFAHAAG